MVKVAKKSNRFSFRKILIVITLLFILLTIPIVVIYVIDKNPKESRSHASEIEVASFNSQIESNIASGETSRNTFLLTQRKEQMEYLAATNPQAFLQNTYDSSRRDRFPDNQKAFIEEQAQISGRLVEAYKDNFKDKKYKKVYFIQNNEGTFGLKTPLELSEDEAKSGRNVSASGYKVSNLIVAPNESVSITGEALSVASSKDIDDYLVMPVNFIGDRSRPYSQGEIGNKFFGSSNTSGAQYFKRVTGNRYVFNGTVMPWQESNIKRSSVCDNADQLIKYAESKVNINNYYGVIFVFPKIKDCDWLGMGTMDGNPRIIWINEFDLDTIAHELGHNIGLDHAALMQCVLSGCKTDSYGDMSDLMGYILGNINSPHRMGLGIMVADGVKEFKSNGTFTLHKLSGGSTPQVLLVNDPGSDKDIYVEFRGGDSPYSTKTTYNVDSGVLIYRWDGKKSSKTYLMDITPGDNNWDNLILKDGKSYSIGPVKIKQISHDSNSAKIRVEKR